MKRTWFATLLCLFGLFALPMGARAQGVTTAAVSGTVTGAEGAPLQGITITATNTATGTQARVVTRSDGRYLLSGLQPGSYRLEARGLGYAPATRTGVNLALSQTEEVDFGLVSEALALEGLTVSAERSNDVISKGRTGASTVVNDSAIHRLPTITRDFTDFTRLTPQISTGGAGTSAAGRNNRFNSIQIDGAVNNDLFGLAASGTPGGQAGTKPITLEAIQEFQVVIAPFDVRQNGFTGAGINAITKSGTNELDGSFSFYGRNQDFVGNFNVPGTGEESDEVADFDESNFAGAVGGPILRDRLFFFVAGERTTRSAPVNTVVGTPSTGLSVAQAEQVADYLRTTFGYDAGAIGAVNLDRESTNLFGRLDFNINGSNRLTLRHNYVDAGDDNLSRGFTYNLGNGGYRFSSTTNSTVGQLNSQIGGFF
ncbi:MAG: carboxypeptidase regulatory-like domain-containing protein [Longimicrobiaceae bacterium]